MVKVPGYPLREGVIISSILPVMRTCVCKFVPRGENGGVKSFELVLFLKQLFFTELGGIGDQIVVCNGEKRQSTRSLQSQWLQVVVQSDG